MNEALTELLRALTLNIPDIACRWTSARRPFATLPFGQNELTACTDGYLKGIIVDETFTIVKAKAASRDRKPAWKHSGPLAASCTASKKALLFLRLAGEHSMTDTEATTLFQQRQQMLPAYMNNTLSNITTEAEAAHIRDALHFAQSLPVFSTAVSSKERDDPAINIFRRLRNEWAKLLPARHPSSDPEPSTTLH
ncbi:hypothetical protein N7516_005270 [Penicillium verrucosum]|uniref:uncharacterized protein n=1 Tax=Penicillium verrucosum TaxID=60171 RepID=UPI0025456106|nr:uncharacterized protein N7516_005270 [Penicillium verrucosum]KAJ5945102.1 hypothetical protein N7516_005270 [Penicillium verrucosum]